MAGSVSGRTPWPRLKTWPVPVPSAAPGEHVARGRLDHRPRRQAQRGIEVALQRVVRARRAGAPRRGGPASRRRPRRSPPSPSARAARRCRRRRGSSARRGRRRPPSTARVAGRAKRAYSAGESEPAQLSKSCTAWAPASIWARSEATAMDDQPVRQLLPQCRVAVHERLDPGEGARRAALDEVAGHGERRAGEADERHPRPLELPARPGAPSRRRRGRRRRARTAGAGPGRRSLRNGSATTGPRPGSTSTPKPMACTGTTMSENRMAASTP